MGIWRFLSRIGSSNSNSTPTTRKNTIYTMSSTDSSVVGYSTQGTNATSAIPTPRTGNGNTPDRLPRTDAEILADEHLYPQDGTEGGNIGDGTPATPTTPTPRPRPGRVAFTDPLEQDSPSQGGPSSNTNPRQAPNAPPPSGQHPGPTSNPSSAPRQNPNIPLPHREPRQQPAPETPNTPLWGLRSQKTPIFVPDRSEEPVPTDKTSRLASSILKQLRPPNAYTANSQAWGPSDSAILSDNLHLLLSATANSKPHEVGSRKRTHSEAKDPNDSNDEASRGDPHRGLKRLKNNKVHVKPLVDLAVLAPQPLRADYKTHPLQDRSDQWFIEVFNQLFKMCDNFARTYFGVHNLDAGEFFEPWELGLSDEFISWAEQVAEEDPHMGGWDSVLRNTVQRQWLVMAILVRIMKVKIFDVDLWGANKEQVELLFGIERAFLNREGFQRTELRSQTVRKILGLSPVTQNFYPETATLTAQISLLLKPLSDYLYSIPPTTNTPLPTLENQYQALHNIISTAAYLSLCMRLSPSIFYFNDIPCGEPYDRADHWNLEMLYYTTSKQVVTNLYNAELAAWQADKDDALAALKKLERKNRVYTPATRDLIDETEKVTTAEYERATQAKLAVVARQPKEPGQLYRPMTKMSVWPVITRYKAGSDEDDEAERNGTKLKIEEKNGFRIFQISKAATIVYFGERDRSQRVGLEEHVEEKRRKARGGGRLGAVRNGVLAAAAMVGLGYVLQNLAVVV